MSWQKVVGAVAPTLATMLGGPLLGTATSAIMGALGITDEKDLEVALTKASPETLARLKEADMRMQVELEKIGVDYAKIDSDRLASAHQREAQTNDSWTPRLLAVFICSLATVCVYMVIAHFAGMNEVKLPEWVVALVSSIIGQVFMKLGTVFDYYFGGSATRRPNERTAP